MGGPGSGRRPGGAPKGSQPGMLSRHPKGDYRALNKKTPGEIKKMRQAAADKRKNKKLYG